jgi:glycosyltransferase involved in cell wall biosynthesis
MSDSRAPRAAVRRPAAAGGRPVAATLPERTAPLAESLDNPRITVPEVAATTTPMRVLHVITRLNVGGPARHTLAVVEGLRRQGVDAQLIHGVADPGEGTLDNVLIAESLGATMLPSLGRPLRPWSDFRALVQLSRLMFTLRPDVVHTHTAKAGALGRLAALVYNATHSRSRRCAVVHTFHGHVFSGYFGPRVSAGVQFVERRMASLTDRIIVVSAGQQDEICQRYRIAAPSKVEVLEPGTDLGSLLRLDTNAGLRHQIGFEDRDVVFGYVGRFVPIKDLTTLIRAFARTTARCAAARLMLVGDGEQRRLLENLVAELRLGDRVRFTGWLRDMAAVYGAIDVAVLSSRNEGTPLALVEAMAAGKPVISTRVGGIEDFVSDGQTGLLIPPGDVARFTEAMALLCCNPSERRRLGQGGRESVAQRFSQNPTVGRLMHLYSRGLARRRSLAGDA